MHGPAVNLSAVASIRNRSRSNEIGSNEISYSSAITVRITADQGGLATDLSCSSILENANFKTEQTTFRQTRLNLAVRRKTEVATAGLVPGSGSVNVLVMLPIAVAI